MNDNVHKRLGLVECLELLTERCAAPAPTGPTRKNLLGDVTVVDTSGHWIYPTSLYNGAGGACGGSVGDKAKAAGESLFGCFHNFLYIICNTNLQK